MNCLPPRTVGTTITESFRNTGWPPLRNILSKPSYINQGENGGSQIIKTSTLICNFFSYIFYCILFDFPLLILLLLADNPQSSSSSSSSSSSASSSTSASSGWFLPHPPLLLFLWKRGENVSCIFSSPFNISPTSFPPPTPFVRVNDDKNLSNNLFIWSISFIPNYQTEVTSLNTVIQQWLCTCQPVS